MIVRFMFGNPTAWWKQWGSKLIRKVDGSPASHFAIAVFSPSSPDFVYESVFPRFRKIRYDEWLKEYKLVKKVDFVVPKNLEFAVNDWLQMMIGVPYSVPQLALIAISLLGPLKKALNWAILNHKRALICTEVGSRFIEAFTHIEIKESHDNVGVNDMFTYTRNMEKYPNWRSE